MSDTVRDGGLEDGQVYVDAVAVPWAEVYAVDWGGEHAYIATSRGVGRVTAEEGRSIEQRIAPWEARRDAWVEARPDRERQRWLGSTTRRGVLVTHGWRRPGARSLYWGIRGLVTLLGGVPLVGMAWEEGWVMVLLAAGCALAIAAVAMGEVAAFWPSVTADRRGLRWKQDPEPSVRWSQVRALLAPTYPANVVAPVDSEILLQTTVGRIHLDREVTGIAGLERGLRALLDARAVAVPATAAGYFAPHREELGCGLWVDAESLTVVERNASQRHLWQDARQLVPTAGDGRLVFTSGFVDLDDYGAVEPVLEIAERHVTVAAAYTPTEVTADQIEQWLGVVRHGSLELQVTDVVALTVGALALTAVLAVVLLLAVSTPWLWIAGYAVGLFVATLLCRATVRADRHGLTRRSLLDHEQVAWADVRSLDRWGRVHYQQRHLYLRHGGRAGKLEAAVRRVLRNRLRGRTVTRARPIDETALSRAADPATTQPRDRGLSQAEPEQTTVDAG